MTVNIPEQVGILLEELGARLGVVTSELWNVIIRQQLAEGVSFVVVGLVFAVLMVLCICNMKCTTAVSLPLDICALFCGFIAAATLISGVKVFYNPQFYALNYLLKLLK
ncbi:MAG: hypothetical protein PHI12_13245 [Dehalococcoidales bacterium]|nr:hypothetical protein [Dehalococcoidales bacterium]